MGRQEKDMTARKLIIAASSIVASMAAFSQSPSVEVKGQSLRFSEETSTLHCSKACVVTIAPTDNVRVEAARFMSNPSTGVVTLEGSVRLVVSFGEVLAESGVITTDANGVKSFRSDEMRIVSPK
jgi:hypothetical protein